MTATAEGVGPVLSRSCSSAGSCPRSRRNRRRPRRSPPGFSDTRRRGWARRTDGGGRAARRALPRHEPGRERCSSSTTERSRSRSISRHCPRSARTASEGLLGVTVDPQFASNDSVYLFYTARTNGSCALNGASAGGAKNRVSRFTLNGIDRRSLDPRSILLDNMPEWGGNHNGGDVRSRTTARCSSRVGDGGGGTARVEPGRT